MYSLNAFSTSNPNTVCNLPYFFCTYHFVQVPAKPVNPAAVDALKMIPVCVLDHPLKFLHVVLALSAYLLVHLLFYNFIVFASRFSSANL